MPSALVVVAAIALYALLPEQLIVGPRLVIPVLEAVLLTALIIVNPRRMTRDNRVERWAALSLVALIATANMVALILLLRQLRPADFRFPQDEDHDTVDEVQAGSSKVSDWVPAIVDYLYVSLSNSSAFSPTDTMPLSTRAKVLMGIESTAALVDLRAGDRERGRQPRPLNPDGTCE